MFNKYRDRSWLHTPMIFEFKNIAYSSYNSQPRTLKESEEYSFFRGRLMISADNTFPYPFYNDAVLYLSSKSGYKKELSFLETLQNIRYNYSSCEIIDEDYINPVNPSIIRLKISLYDLLFNIDDYIAEIKKIRRKEYVIHTCNKRIETYLLFNESDINRRCKNYILRQLAHHNK